MLQNTSFINKLTNLINEYSLENGSNTPDYILANYLMGCLNLFNVTVDAREEWYGRISAKIQLHKHLD